MDVVSVRGEGAKVYGGFYAAPQSEIKKGQKHRQTEGISCHEMQNRSCRSLSFICFSFSKGNTSQEIMGWVGTKVETLGQN